MKDWFKLFGVVGLILLSIAFAVGPTILICLALARYLGWL